MQSNAKTVILVTQRERWQRTAFCQGKQLGQRSSAQWKQWPLITIDGSGNIWQGCTDGPTPPMKVVAMPSSAAAIGPPPTRMPDGSCWVDTGSSCRWSLLRRAAFDQKMAAEIRGPSHWQRRKRRSGWCHAASGDGAASPSLKRVPTSGGDKRRGAGWFRYDSGCETAKPCIL